LFDWRSKVKYAKLVRDKIPEIITRSGDRPVTRVLDANVYQQELRRKLQEEVTEFIESENIGELVDILEVLYTLAAEGGISPPQLEEMRKQKRKERGGFDCRIFLVEIIS
jgi:predicted house-cleaning noncanonical NTP pyrophosphatase (MazG superfamily)